MGTPAARAFGQDVEVTLDESARTPSLRVRFPGRDSPVLTCSLVGTVLPDTSAVHGEGLTFRLRPFPDDPVSGHGALEVEVAVTPDVSGTGLTVTVDGPADYPFELVTVPGAFRLSGASAQPWHFAIPLAEGHSLPADSSPGLAARLPDRVDLFGSWITLPLIALTRGRDAAGGSLLVTTPQGDDHAVHLLREDGPNGPGFELVQCASLGRFGYRRVWRLVWVGAPGLVELAATIRAELRAAGMQLQGLPDKLAARGMPPELQEAVGGTHLWWHVDPIPKWLAPRLRAEGIRSVAVMGRADPEAAQATREAGLIAGTYYMTSDIYPPGSVEPLEWRNLFPPHGCTEGWPDELARSREGWLIPNWVHTPAPTATNLWDQEEFLTERGRTGSRAVAAADFVPTQGYARCPHFHVGAVERWAQPLLTDGGYSGSLCDVTTANGAYECFAPVHPCDRRTDVAQRRAQLELLGAGGRLVASEAGKWWALDETDAFEGMLKYDEASLNNRVLGDYPFREEWWDTQFNLELRIPLFGLVARHAVVRTLWWGHGQDRHAVSWGAKDALCALFGGNPIFVSDPVHPLEPGSARWDRFRSTARAFDLLRRRTFGLAIQRYETVNRHVAVTQFEDGTQVRANVGPVPSEGLEGGSFEMHDQSGTQLWP